MLISSYLSFYNGEFLVKLLSTSSIEWATKEELIKISNIIKLILNNAEIMKTMNIKNSEHEIQCKITTKQSTCMTVELS